MRMRIHGNSYIYRLVSVDKADRYKFADAAPSPRERRLGGRMRLAAVSGTPGYMSEKKSACTAKAFTAEHPTAPERRQIYFGRWLLSLVHFFLPQGRKK